MIECALIPPVAMLSYNKSQKFQLMLPHLIRDQKYRRSYRGYCNDEEKYVILDNGAAESVHPLNASLIKIAGDFGVDEVVAPDVLSDKNGTVVKTSHFLNALMNSPLWEKKDVKVGVVAQGFDHKEAFKCVELLVNSYLGDRIGVVYIPRLLVNSNHLEARLLLAHAIHVEWPHLEIHFLGASRLWLQEPLAMATATPFVRSIDTSVPFTEAFYSRPLGKNLQGKPRPDRYFGWATSSDIKLEIIEKNVRRYLGWTRGESTQRQSVSHAL